MVTDSQRRRILTAPLRSTSARLTSRDVAALSRVSQATVVREWGRSYDPALVGEPALGAIAALGPARLARVQVGPPGCVLTLAPAAPPPAPRTAGDKRLLRLTLRALLATDLLSGAARRTVRCPRGDVELAPEQWQALLVPLESALAAEPAESLAGLLGAVRRWAAHREARPEDSFDWRPGATQLPVRRVLPISDQPTADQRLSSVVIAAIQTQILAGRLQSGDRVTESFVSRAAHVSRNRAREALRTLAHDGLVDLEAGPGAVVPEPTVEDVKETYAARRALGAIVMQRATDWRPERIAPVRHALERFEAAAATGDSWITGQVDLDFQDAIANSVDMRRIPSMFNRLRVQLEMFIAVMGLDYAYDVPAMIADDTGLFAAIIRRDVPGVLRLWDRKMTEAAQYMTRQLEARHRL